MLKQIGFLSTLSAAGLFVLGLISSNGLASFGGSPSENELDKKAGKSKFYAGRFHNLDSEKSEMNRHGFGRFLQIAAKFYSRPKGKTEPGKTCQSKLYLTSALLRHRRAGFALPGLGMPRSWWRSEAIAY